MDSTLLGILFFVTALARVSCDDYRVFPGSTSVVEGEGLVLTLQPSGIPLKGCGFNVKGQSWVFDGSNTIGTLNTSYWGRGLEFGDCGFLVENYSPSQHEGSWRIRAYNKAGSVIGEARAQVQTQPPPNIPKSEEIVTSLGKSESISCSSLDAWQCSLTDPHGLVVRNGKDNCSYKINAVKMRDVGNWKCMTTLRGIAVEKITDFTIQVSTVKTLDIGIQENDTMHYIYCNIKVSDSPVEFCQFERPDGKAFQLKEGSNAGRYTYYGEGIQTSACGISIKKPLVHEDYGLWSCKLHLSDNRTNGGFVNLSKTKSTKLSRNAVLQSLTGPEKQMILNGTTLTMRCSIRETLKYCWFRHPNGTRFPVYPQSNTATEGSVRPYEYVGEGLEVGDCGMRLPQAVVNDSGEWMCGMGVDFDDSLVEDIEKVISVLVSETRITENRTTTTVSEGDFVVLGCRSLFGEALQYCRFEAPDGVSYSLTSGKPSTHKRYSYTGNGLENGDCGLLINSVKVEDYGTWKCAAMLIEQNQEEYYKNLIIKAPGFSTSSAIGITVGVVVVAVVGAAYLVYRYKYRSKQQREPRDTRETAFSVTSAISDISEEIELTPRRAPVVEAGPLSMTSSEGEV